MHYNKYISTVGMVSDQPQQLALWIQLIYGPFKGGQLLNYINTN
jgi:hypothetical protein